MWACVFVRQQSSSAACGGCCDRLPSTAQRRKLHSDRPTAVCCLQLGCVTVCVCMRVWVWVSVCLLVCVSTCVYFLWYSSWLCTLEGPVLHGPQTPEPQVTAGTVLCVYMCVRCMILQSRLLLLCCYRWPGHNQALCRDACVCSKSVRSTYSSLKG